MEKNEPPLPPHLDGWFKQRGWAPHKHQLEMLSAAQRGEHCLLIAPTGGGKTLAGFLPSLVDLGTAPEDGLHTLYISPLKALAVDIARNLETPIAEMALPIRAETRTGDTPSSKKQRQRVKPPHMLMTTPESLSILLSYPDAPEVFGNLKAIIIDEIHAFAPTKRGDLLSLALARLQTLAPQMRRIGLSATIADEDGYLNWLSAGDDTPVTKVRGLPRKTPDIQILEPNGRIPWSGHTATHAAPELYDLIKAHQMTIVFVNTRSQTEMIFRALWDVNEDDLPIGLHHGSLDVAQRRKVEAAMAAGKLRAVVATASLDLGLDWGNVDLVIQIGAPKGASRLLQRIGRSNHRFNAASKAILVPGNRFEYLEAQAAIDAVHEGDLDGEPFKPGAYDVLAQHIMGAACAEAFDPDELFAEIKRAAPFKALERETFDQAIAFVENGGYSLRRYDRFQRIIQRPDGRYAACNKRLEHLYRMNAGAIIDQPGLKVKFRTGRTLGEIDEWYASGLSPGDTFLFSGRTLEVERIETADLYVRVPSKKKAPRIPTYQGNRMPLSTNLADRVRGFFAEPERWTLFPDEVREWLGLQQTFSQLPPREGLLVETFPQETRYGPRHFIVAYGFEGYNAHHSLGMLVTRRMESLGYAPIGFVGTDYMLAAWSMNPVTDAQALFSNTILQDELMDWVGSSSLLKRAFMEVAQISGLVERNQPGQKKTGRQMMFSSDLIFDVLKKYEPDHVLMQASWQDAKGRLTDVERLASFLERIQGRILHRKLERISPLAVPAVVELNVQSVDGEAREMLFSQAEDLLRIAVSGA